MIMDGMSGGLWMVVRRDSSKGDQAARLDDGRFGASGGNARTAIARLPLRAEKRSSTPGRGRGRGRGRGPGPGPRPGREQASQSRRRGQSCHRRHRRRRRRHHRPSRPVASQLLPSSSPSSSRRARLAATTPARRKVTHPSVHVHHLAPPSCLFPLGDDTDTDTDTVPGPHSVHHSPFGSAPPPPPPQHHLQTLFGCLLETRPRAPAPAPAPTLLPFSLRSTALYSTAQLPAMHHCRQ
ncbi:hypothetical protein IWX90DRAFT_310074 [Phyllosticta citrichinensis]|uniref:Uncharacterized protein n=1 Tax=Phyllosticta citrichinensis TaxID=1130410 RepID=A0ABR1XLX2_9PEZI